MRKVDISVQDLVNMVERGELRLPEMQRRYVWRASRVRDLLDSLYRGYPSGSILVWETDQAQPSRDLAVSQQASPFEGHKLLLDGQQRVTSLSAILRGEPVAVRNKKRPIDILFNLEHPEGMFEFTEVTDDVVDSDDESDDEEEEETEISIQERLKRSTFVVASKALAQQPNWVSVSEVFKASDDLSLLEKAGVTDLKDPRLVKYQNRLQKLRAIRSYQYVMQVLPRELSYEEVAEIFVRVNSLGVKLRGSDLALAQITARWRDSLRLLEEFQEECEEDFMSLDLGLLVRAMVIFATGQSRFESVSNVPTTKLQAGWESAKDGLRFAINFLRQNAGIEDETILSSPFFFLVLAYLGNARGEKFHPDEERRLLLWLNVANARGRFSRGSTETLLDSDLAAISRGQGVLEMLDVLRQQFGRLHIQTADFVRKGPNSPLFNLVFLALRARGARDWETGLKIGLGLQGKNHRIQYHHIIPKSLIKDRYDRREVNEMANMAFISGKTNRKISNKNPLEYLAKIAEEKGEEYLQMQGVPLDRELWNVENYPKFLEERRRLLTEICNGYLDSFRVEE
jgi:hypothetical protein